MNRTDRSESLSAAGGAPVARMVVVTISALLLFASPGLAVVVPFGSSSTINTLADDAWSVHAADVDGDGDVDVLSASHSWATVAWYENDGGDPPAFTERLITTAAAGALSVHAADVDGDGDMDILSASGLDDTVAWYENDRGSPPSFTEHVITTAADGAHSVHVADVDGDGDMDVLSASSEDDTVAWYENDGASPPVFTAHVITTAADGATSVHAVDVDGDGDMDVLSASLYDDTVAWYENDGASPPSFTERVITAAADGVQSVHAVDVDGDGDVDVLSASFTDDTVAWYANNGANPPAFTEHVITAGADGARSVHTADVDGDGDVDILSASTLDGTVAWYENDGANTPAFREHVITIASNLTSVRAADVDGDGDVDVLSASGVGNALAWYKNWSPHPDLTFRSRRITAAADGAFSVHAADVDGDGDVDVLSASPNDATIAWYENDGSISPSFTQRVITATAQRAISVHAADVDGDGDVDVLSSSQYDDTVAWYENDGGRPAGFTPRVIATTAADYAYWVHAADVDGDGDVDVLLHLHWDDTIAWYENDGGRPPGFTRRVITAAAGGPRLIHTADVDGDGDVDVLSSSGITDTMAWYENDGASPPAFTQRAITTAAGYADSAHAADVDGDGDVDVLSASHYDDTVAWYENDGGSPPGFTRRVITAAAEGASSVHASDVDGDGDMDVLSTSGRDDTVAWYENDGASLPGFTRRVIAAAADDARSVHAADINGDGHLDILSASHEDDTIRWYENRPDVAVILPVDVVGLVDCRTPGVRATRPRIVWDPGPYDRFRVQISWDPAFAKGTRITSGKKLLSRKAWRPGAKAWRRTCNNASPYLYIRVFGEDVNIGKRSPIRNVMSAPVQVEPVH